MAPTTWRRWAVDPRVAEKLRRLLHLEVKLSVMPNAGSISSTPNTAVDVDDADWVLVTFHHIPVQMCAVCAACSAAMHVSCYCS
jgi:hypothetical protein